MDINRILRETFVVEAEHRGELGSTNDRALERAKQGATHLPLLVIADRQTAGAGGAEIAGGPARAAWLSACCCNPPRLRAKWNLCP